MAASKKSVIPTSAAAAGPPRDAGRAKTRTRAKTVEVVGTVEVVEAAEVPDLMPPEVLAQIAAIETLLPALEKMAEPELVETMVRYSAEAAGFSHQALRAGAQALVSAWACGRVLLAAKAKFGRGKFGAWRQDRLVPAVMSERTSQRYMRLAEECPDVRLLLKWSPGLRQAYISCGILPELDREAAKQDKGRPSPAKALIASISGLEKRFRRFSSSPAKFRKADIIQLKVLKDELDRWFREAIG